MKKSVIILGTTLVILSLLFIGYTNWNKDEDNGPNSLSTKDLALENQNVNELNNTVIPDLYYGVDARFAAVKKSGNKFLS